MDYALKTRALNIEAWLLFAPPIKITGNGPAWDYENQRCRDGITFEKSPQYQGRIQPVRLGEAISVIFGSQVSTDSLLQKRWSVLYITLWKNNGRQNGPISRMFFSEFCKIMVNKVTLAGFKGDDRLLPWIRLCIALMINTKLSKNWWRTPLGERSSCKIWRLSWT